MSLSLLARWNHKILRFVFFFFFFESEGESGPHKTIEKSFLFVFITFLTSLSSSRGYTVYCIPGYVVGCVWQTDCCCCWWQRVFTYANAEQAEEKKKKKFRQPSHLIILNPDQRNTQIHIYRSACGNCCAIYNSSIYIDGSPSFVKGKNG